MTMIEWQPARRPQRRVRRARRGAGALLTLTLFAPALLAAAVPAVAAPRPGMAASAPALLAEEPPPRGAARQFKTDFSRHTVPYAEVLSGGPPKDGIPALDNPRFIGVAAADWLEAREPVVLVEAGGAAKAYPLQVLTWHEIVNDEVGGVPIAVTFCPLCNTAIGFKREFDAQVLDFGTTGRLRYSNLNHVRPPDRDLVAAGHRRGARRPLRRQPAGVLSRQHRELGGVPHRLSARRGAVARHRLPARLRAQPLRRLRRT